MQHVLATPGDVPTNEVLSAEERIDRITALKALRGDVITVSEEGTVPPESSASFIPSTPATAERR
jgi:hypothetical protein